MKKYKLCITTICLICIFAAILSGCGRQSNLCDTPEVNNRPRQESAEWNNSKMEFYADNLGIPMDEETAIKTLGDYTEERESVYNFGSMILTFGYEKTLKQIRVLSPDLDPLGNGVKVGSPVQDFYDAYHNAKDNRANFGEYSYLDNVSTISIEIKEDSGVISEIFIEEVVYK